MKSVGRRRRWPSRRRPSRRRRPLVDTSTYALHDVVDVCVISFHAPVAVNCNRLVRRNVSQKVATLPRKQIFVHHIRNPTHTPYTFLSFFVFHENYKITLTLSKPGCASKRPTRSSQRSTIADEIIIASLPKSV
jgi:hypothetical protein